MHLEAIQAKGCWQHHKPEERPGTESPPPPRVSRRNQPCRHVNFRLPASQSERQSTPVGSSHPVGGNLLRQLQKTNTNGMKEQLNGLSGLLKA